MTSLAWLGCAAASSGAGSPQLGQALSEQDIRVLDRSVGALEPRLPAGSGTPSEGRILYEALCSPCHGQRGEGGTADHLVADGELTGEWPDKAIGTYWPYATTLFDFVRRAMPMDSPGSLSDEDTYAVTAYLLFLNGILDESTLLDAKTLAGVTMPNRDGFDRCYPERPHSAGQAQISCAP